MKKQLIAITTLILTLCQAPSIMAAPNITELIQKLDNILEMNTDVKAKVDITQQKANQGIKKYELIYFREDKTDSFLIVFTNPEYERGNGYLKIDNNFWMYRRNTRTFQHIGRDESISGTDASAQDFEKRNLQDLYKPALDQNNHEKISQTTIGKIPVYQFEIIAKNTDAADPKLIFWVREDNFLPLKEEAYSLSGTLTRTTYYLKYTTINDHFICIKSMYLDEFEKGNKSIVEISGISLSPIDKEIFTKTYLETISK